MPLGPFSAKEHVEITSLGMEFALTIIAGGGLGYWLDKKCGTSPWLLVIGVLSGFALGLYIVIRSATVNKKAK